MPHAYSPGCTSSCRPKWGLGAGGPLATEALLQSSIDPRLVAWLYDYGNEPTAFNWNGWVAPKSNAEQLLRYMNDNSIEFVPMVAARSFHPSSGPTDAGGTCFLVTNESPSQIRGKVACTVDQMVEQLAGLRDRLVAPVRFLGTTNEPWFLEPEMSGEEAAEIWRLYLQPAAAAAGLSLLSPTINLYDWLGDFLRACYDRRFSNPPCDVETIAAFTVHEYECSERFWRERYGGGGFRNRASSEMGGYGGKDWGSFFGARRFWVTETNCNWEDSGSPDGTEQCLRASGGRPATHGRGSIATMNELADVVAYAWWTITNGRNPGTKQFNARILDQRGNLLPPGRALVSINRQDTRFGTGGTAISCTGRLVASSPPPPWPPLAPPTPLPPPPLPPPPARPPPSPPTPRPPPSAPSPPPPSPSPPSQPPSPLPPPCSPPFSPPPSRPPPRPPPPSFPPPSSPPLPPAPPRPSSPPPPHFPPALPSDLPQTPPPPPSKPPPCPPAAPPQLPPSPAQPPYLSALFTLEATSAVAAMVVSLLMATGGVIVCCRMRSRRQRKVAEETSAGSGTAAYGSSSSSGDTHAIEPASDGAVGAAPALDEEQIFTTTIVGSRRRGKPSGKQTLINSNAVRSDASGDPFEAERNATAAPQSQTPNSYGRRSEQDLNRLARARAPSTRLPARGLDLDGVDVQQVELTTTAQSLPESVAIGTDLD